jgi:hypothetical protein
MKGYEQPLLNFFDAHPMVSSIPVGNFTIYPKRDLYARAKEGLTRPDVCAALQQCGMGDYVSDWYNVNQLSAWVREVERNNEDLLRSGEVKDLSELIPKQLAAVLDIEPTRKLQARRNSKGTRQ